MKSFTDEQIKEIAGQLDCGFKCFWNRQTNELLFIPDKDRFPESDNDVFDEDIQKLKNNFDDYEEIEPMQSRDSFEIMQEFTEKLIENSPLRKHLTYALNNKKPFREFKNIIDNSGEYREEWFAFRNEKLKDWVLRKIEKKS